MHFLIALIILLPFGQAFGCAGTNSSLDDILNDPDIKRMLAQPLRLRSGEADVPASETLTRAELRTQKISELESEIEALEKSRSSTPAEIARAKRRLEDLKTEEAFEHMLSQPLRLRSEGDRLLITDDALPASPPEPVALSKVDEKPAFPTYEDTPITDADRAAFAELLKRPVKTNPYDNALARFSDASERYPVDSKYKDPLTGERIDVEVIGMVKSTDTADVVKIKFQTPDGRTVTKEVRMTSLTHPSRGYDNPLDDPETLSGSDRFSGGGLEGKSQQAVDRMAQDAMTAADRKEYFEIQRKLDSRETGVDGMLNLISRQEDIVRKYAPLRVHEIETVKDNLDGLEQGIELTLTPGEKRAIADVRRIIDIREGNPRVLEDREIFERARDLSEESVLKKRYANRRKAVSAEIKKLTGEGRSIPFEKRNTWSSSSLSRDVGGLRGSSKFKEHFDSISTFLKNDQFLSSDNARAVEVAIRDIRSRIRSDNMQVPDSQDFLRYLELRLEDYKLSMGPRL